MLERWNLVSLVAPMMVNTMVLVLSRYLTYLCHMMHFPLEQNYLTESIAGSEDSPPRFHSDNLTCTKQPLLDEPKCLYPAGNTKRVCYKSITTWPDLHLSANVSNKFIGMIMRSHHTTSLMWGVSRQRAAPPSARLSLDDYALRRETRPHEIPID